MKTLMVIGDGMADMPIEALEGQTPLSYLKPEGFSRVGAGELYRLTSCPEGLPPGSDVAFLTLFGNEPKTCYNGRSPLEAAGLGVSVNPGEVAFRLNLCAITDEGYPNAKMCSHNGGGIDGDEAYQLITALMADAEMQKWMNECGMRITPTPSFRHVAVMPGSAEGMDMVPPHDIVGEPIKNHMPKGADVVTKLMQRSFVVLNEHPINVKRRKEGLLPANTAWLWGAGSAYELENFERKYGAKGTAISAVPLVKGIARLCGLEVPSLPGATGLLDTDYEGKVEAALAFLGNGGDFALVHVEAPDELSHDGNLPGKLESIRRLDERVVIPLLDKLRRFGAFRLALMPDHYTLLSTRTHDATPVPIAIYDSETTRGQRPYTEAGCRDARMLPSGDALLRTLLRK